MRNHESTKARKHDPKARTQFQGHTCNGEADIAAELASSARALRSANGGSVGQQPHFLSSIIFLTASSTFPFHQDWVGTVPSLNFPRVARCSTLHFLLQDWQANLSCTPGRSPSTDKNDVMLKQARTDDSRSTLCANDTGITLQYSSATIQLCHAQLIQLCHRSNREHCRMHLLIVFSRFLGGFSQQEIPSA